MQEVLVVKPDPTEEELATAKRHADLTPPIGVIVTEPRHLKIAEAFGVDIVPMFNQPKQALEAAKRISEESDSLVVLIGEICPES
jgi:hypothetical protein